MIAKGTMKCPMIKKGQKVNNHGEGHEGMFQEHVLKDMTLEHKEKKRYENWKRKCEKKKNVRENKNETQWLWFDW